MHCCRSLEGFIRRIGQNTDDIKKDLIYDRVVLDLLRMNIPKLAREINRNRDKKAVSETDHKNQNMLSSYIQD